MPLIHYSEMDDFKATIIKAGLNVDDFEVTEQADAPAATEHMNTGTVTVTYKPTGFAHEYRGGHLSTWTVEFDDDLNRNVFQTR